MSVGKHKRPTNCPLSSNRLYW